MKIRIKKLLPLTSFICGVLWLFYLINASNVMASGGWISGGASGVSTSGGGSGGGNCSGNTGYYDLACTGYSWIFYEYIGGEENSHAIYFRRDGYMEDFGLGAVNNIIDKSCSEHGSGDGFWHLGYNMKGMEYSTGIYVFGDDLGGVKDISSWNVVYSTGPSKWGHAMTFDYNSIPTYYKQNGGYKIYSNGSLDHVIYMKKNGSYVPMYKAVRFGTESDVLRDYKVVYKNINGKDYSGSTLPGNVYAFCSWGGSGSDNEEYDIKRQNIQIEDNTNIGNEVTVASGVTGEVSVSQSNPDPSMYKFVGWKTVNTYNESQVAPNLKTSNIMTRTSSDGGYVTYLDPNSIRSEGEVYCGSDAPSSNGVYCANEGTRRIYDTVVANVDSEQARKVYAYYAKKYVLTINAGEGTNIEVDRVGSHYSVKSENLSSGAVIYSDDSLRICATAKNGYKLNGFSINSRQITYYNKYCIDLEYYMVSGDTVISATAELDNIPDEHDEPDDSAEFKGKIVVSGSTTGSVGWTNEKNVKSAFVVEGCSWDGCDVEFNHFLKLNSGSGNTEYTISRSSDLNSKVRTDNSLRMGVYYPDGVGGSGEQLKNDKVTMFPGMKVCEKMVFRPDGPRSIRLSNIEVCVQAINGEEPCEEDYCPNPECTPGDPDCPNSNPGSSVYRDESLINLKVANNSLSSGFVDQVFAKPGDQIQFRAQYNPKLQYTRELVPDNMRINSGGRVLNQSGSSLQDLFNNNNGAMADWNNAYTVKWGRDNINIHTLEIGSTEEDISINGYGIVAPKVGVVSYINVGTEMKENAQINRMGYLQGQSTPTYVGFSVENNKMTANVRVDTISDEASVKVPYNFSNSTFVNEDSGERIVYAGEENNVIKYTVMVGTKYNKLTKGNYATPVPNAKWGIMVKYGEGAWSDYIQGGSGSLNYDNYKYNGARITKETKIEVPDVPAGTQVCVKSWVWPASSGSDSNTQTNGFEDRMVESDGEVCYTVAKKPSFQVWGGDLVIDGSANVPISKKKSLSGYGDGNYIFGSWVENGLFVTGTSAGIASGASLGYVSNSKDGLWPVVSPIGNLGNNADIDGREPGGNVGNNLCVTSVLSFANNNCGNGVVGFGASVSSGEVNNLEMISDYMQGDPRDISELHDIGGVLGVLEGGVSYYTQKDNSIDIGISPSRPMKVSKNNVVVVYAQNADILISGNIEYDEEGYSSLVEIPKLILYADKSIIINCSVSRVDAVLIAGGAVYTCYNDYSEDGGVKPNRNINLKARSVQLRINGAIVANKLILGRTYGAATGANSMVPAEIINYDTSLYIQKHEQADTTTTTSSPGKLIESYIHELAPRY